jgi:hypothetical protein
MSRGLGRVERRVVDTLLAAGKALNGAEILARIRAKPTPAAASALRRALVSLRRKELILRQGQAWIHPAVQNLERMRDWQTADARDRETALLRSLTPNKAEARIKTLLKRLGSGTGDEVLGVARELEKLRQAQDFEWENVRVIVPLRQVKVPDAFLKSIRSDEPGTMTVRMRPWPETDHDR